jgi:hypothetical protein
MAQIIEYDAGPETDRLDSSALTGWERRNNTLARKLIRPKVYDLLFHANIKVTPKEDSRDTHSQYRMLRIRRVWAGKLVGQVGSSYKLVPPPSADGGLPAGFFSDSNLDYFGDPTGHWSDTPLENYGGGKNVNESLIQEFVVGIGYLTKARAPVVEYGGLHFLTVIDIGKQSYRVLMSFAKRLSGSEILGVFTAGGISPPYLAGANVPDLGSFRFKPHDWLDYTAHLK